MVTTETKDPLDRLTEAVAAVEVPRDDFRALCCKADLLRWIRATKRGHTGVVEEDI